MQFNTAKCQVMHIGKNNPKNVYMMKGMQLSKTKIKIKISLPSLFWLVTYPCCIGLGPGASGDYGGEGHWSDRQLYPETWPAV